MNRLFWQAVLAFLVLPGTVAFVVPLLLIAPAAIGPFVDASGLIPLALGIVLLLWCVRDFYVAGRGTLAPWALAIYALGVMLAFHLRVVFGEEPWLARTHGETWTRYKDEVPRWFRFRSRFDRGDA